jgi:hypothetical protein
MHYSALSSFLPDAEHPTRASSRERVAIALNAVLVPAGSLMRNRVVSNAIALLDAVDTVQ